jgi:hypothetical protein
MLLTSKMAFQVNCSTESRPSLSENIDRFTTRFSSSYKVITPSLSVILQACESNVHFILIFFRQSIYTIKKD